MEDITYYRNDTAPIRATIRNKKTLLPINLAGKNILLTVDAVENPTDNTGNLVQITGVIEEDPAQGIVKFTPVGADMDFTPGDYWYDVQTDDGGGINRLTVAKGRFYLLQDITK